MSKSQIILGIDPGTIILGYGLIAVDETNLRLIQMGILKLHKYHDHFIRLSKITERITGLINEFHPDEIAIEAPFYGKNVQSMLKLGRAQGAALAPALQIGIPVFEYAPRKIKQAITGHGNASKEQVATLLKHILKFDENPGYLDATDGVAVALCHHYQSGIHKKTSGPASWKDFLKQNPDRIH
ncbi:MAG: crossover junction endodeoxyribonuclease RuvC [Bacteroidales bacterium]|nr:crossover junction endodeoxyribonuclease RuvC [Bacteroidales bacterium]